jgi:oligopeptide/dipeptide ABC transporter ATP-binding protein
VTERDDIVLDISDLTTEIETAAGPIYPVARVSLTVRRGQTLCLVGESGSGKSMLALSVMRVLPAGARISAGSISLAGSVISALGEREIRAVRGRDVAIVPQDPMTAFDPLLKVGVQIVESIRTHLRVSKQDARERMLRALEQVHLPNPERVARALPSQLSGGMNQRALIAMALATEPKLILADEPTTALDVTVQAQVLELLRELQTARGLAILLITHDMGVAAAVADEVAVMYAGKIVERGPKHAIFNEPRHPYTVGLIAAARESFLPGTTFRSIPGAPPNLHALPSGCAFAPRCSFARAECVQDQPALRPFSDQRAACILADDDRPWLTSTRLEDGVNA